MPPMGKAGVAEPQDEHPSRHPPERSCGLVWRALPRFRQLAIARLPAPGVLPADGLGLGKTIQAIGAPRVLLRGEVAGPASIVVPAGSVL